MITVEDARRLSEEARLKIEAEQREKEKWERSEEFQRLEAERKKREDELLLHKIADEIERGIESAIQNGKSSALISYTINSSNETERRKVRNFIESGEIDKLLQPYREAGYRTETAVKTVRWWSDCYIEVSWAEEAPV